MLELLKKQAAQTYTENGALTNSTTLSDCLDLFFCAGALRNADDERIAEQVLRAYAEDPVRTMKIVFFARDIRGGLGERRFFRVAVKALAEHESEAVMRNLPLFSEYGRWDDLIVLLGTCCEQQAVAVIKEQLEKDIEALGKGESVSLLGKWLPSVNTSGEETRAAAKKLAKLLGMRECDYRKTLSALRKRIAIIENNLREQDYSFDYEKQPSKAMFKYREAFFRNDGERYGEYLEAVKKGEKKLNASTLYPYDIVRKCLTELHLKRREKESLDLSWKNLPEIGNTDENCLVVVDGSGSMYWSANRPIDAAISLGIYFAEHNKGGFKNHFITFSESPRLVRIKGKDIYEKTRYCSSFNECANTDIAAVFELLLETAVENELPQEDMPSKLIIVSDMEFDYCVIGGRQAFVFEYAKSRFEQHGYKLPQIVFWNVDSRQNNFPVSVSDTGCALVSGMSTSLFDMVAGDDLDPIKVMDKAIMSERYKAVS